MTEDTITFTPGEQEILEKNMSTMRLLFQRANSSMLASATVMDMMENTEALVSPKNSFDNVLLPALTRAIEGQALSPDDQDITALRPDTALPSDSFFEQLVAANIAIASLNTPANAEKVEGGAQWLTQFTHDWRNFLGTVADAWKRITFLVEEKVTKQKLDGEKALPDDVRTLIDGTVKIQAAITKALGKNPKESQEPQR